MSISSVAASIAALRQQPTPSPLRSAPSQPALRPAVSPPKPAVVTASAVAARQGELLNTLV